MLQRKNIQLLLGEEGGGGGGGGGGGSIQARIAGREFNC